MKFKFTLTFLMSLIVSSSIAQIKGSYIYSAGVDAGSRTLTFNKSNFTDETIGHVSGKFGHGSFKIQNNSLYLNYFKIIDKDSSLYKIDTRDELFGSTQIYFQVFDNKTPMNGCLISLRDQNSDIIISTNTYGDGKADLWIKKIENIQYVTIDFIGYNRVTLPYIRFKNKQSDVFVDLKPQKTMIEDPHTDVYRVINFDEKTLTLVDADQREFVFKKAK